MKKEDKIEGKYKVSGSIIKELSEKIPNDLVAINELIKNSYDAGARKVIIKLDEIEKTLSVIDDGDGMDKDDIFVLLHIAQSNKKYGEINKYGRRNQGSKGLGFLSVFKFGSKVKWETKMKEDTGYEFEINYGDLVTNDNFVDQIVEISKNNSIIEGTKIIIKIDDDKVDTLFNFFSEEMNYKKIIKSFSDNNFEVELIIGNKIHSTKDIEPAENNNKESQICNVKYNNGKMEYYYIDKKIVSEEYPNKLNIDNISLNLILFKLKTGGTQKIDKFYHKDKGKLTPLIYINSNLFNNYSLFDPDITRGRKTSEAIPQIIGEIKIESDNKLLLFNSNRTEFIENPFTNSIKDFLEKINIKIQKDAATYYSKNLKSLFYKSKNTKEKITKSSNFSKDENTSSNLKTVKSNYSQMSFLNNDNKSINPAELVLSKEYEKLKIPSSQINLRNYINSVKDSHGNSINKKSVYIKCNEENLVKGDILQSIDETKILEIKFKYNDKDTGPLIKSLKIEFISVPVQTIINKDFLIKDLGKVNYKINYDNTINKLIKQINSLEVDAFPEMIACSMRAIFEISVKAIEATKKFSSITFSGDLKANVVSIIKKIGNDNSNLTEIDLVTGYGYKQLKNVLSVIKDFESAVTLSHLGVHRSTQSLPKKDIEFIGDKISIFIMIANEMINNAKIK